MKKRLFVLFTVFMAVMMTAMCFVVYADNGEVVADAVTIKPGINMMTGTTSALTGENATQQWLDTLFESNYDSSLSIASSPSDTSDKVIAWTTPALATPEATGELYPSFAVQFGAKLNELCGHTNIHFKMDVNKTAVYGEDDTYKVLNAFWIMNSNATNGNMAYSYHMPANSGKHTIDVLADLIKFQQGNTSTIVTEPTGVRFEINTHKANTVPTVVYLDNMYAVPAYEFKMYSKDGSTLLDTRYIAFDQDGEIITEYLPETGIYGDKYVSSWTTVKGTGAMSGAYKLNNQNVSFYAVEEEELVKNVVYNGEAFAKIGDTKTVVFELCDKVEYDPSLCSVTSSDTSVITAVKGGKGAVLTAVSDGEAQVVVKYGAFEKTISFYVINDKIFEFDFDGKNSGDLNLWTALSNDVTFNYNDTSDARDTMSVSSGKSVTLPKVTDTSVSKYNYLVITAKAQSEANINVAFTTDESTGSASAKLKSGSEFTDCVIDLSALSSWKGNSPSVVITPDKNVEIVKIAFMNVFNTSGELVVTQSGNYLATPGRFVTVSADYLSDAYGVDKGVTWQISGDTDAVFFIENEDGTVSVAARDKKGNVTVTATSKADSTKKKSASIELDVDAQHYLNLREGFSDSMQSRGSANVKIYYDSTKKITVIDSTEGSTSFYFDNMSAPDMSYKYIVYNARAVSENNQGIKVFFKTTADKTHSESKAEVVYFTQNSDGTYTACSDLSKFSTFTAPITADIMHGLRPKISSIELMSMYISNKKPTDKDTKITLTSSDNKITTDSGSVSLTAFAKTSKIIDGDKIKFKIVEGGGEISDNGDGTAEFTAMQNGNVTVCAYLESDSENVGEITIAVSGQKEKIATYDFRYLALGHSYLRHGPFVGWPWDDPQNGNRGMAASAYDKDYFARFKHYLMEEFEGTMYSYAQNISGFERLCVDGMTKEDYKATSNYNDIVQLIKEHKPNLMTIYVGGGNTKANDYDSLYLFYDTLFELVTENVPEGTLIIAANHRTKLNAGRAMMAAAEKYGIPYSDLSFYCEDDSRNNPYYAYLQYPEYDEYIEEYMAENNGAKPTEFRSHPSDLGHDALGKGIFETTKLYVPTTIKPRYIYLPDSLTINASASVSTKTQLTAVANPSDASASVTWSVDNENIAIVDENGVLTPVNNGTVVITAKSKYNDVAATKTITVTGQTPCYTVTYKAGTTDAVTSLPESFEYAKGSFTLSNVYPERTGYKFGGWSLTEGGEAVKSINVTADTTVYATWIFADRFDFDDENYNEGVVFNGFNVFIRDGLLCGNCAPGTGFSVYRENLLLDSEKYDLFKIKILISCDTTVDITDMSLDLIINTIDGSYNFTTPVRANRMAEYYFDISSVTGTITGFIIRPDNLECNGNVDYIVFSEMEEDLVTDAVFEIVSGEQADTYKADFGKSIGICTLVAAAYNDDGYMVGIDIIKKTCDADGVVTVKVSKSLNSSYVKVFAFDISEELLVISKEAVSGTKL